MTMSAEMYPMNRATNKIWKKDLPERLYFATAIAAGGNRK
jgi:hypothetical protein